MKHIQKGLQHYMKIALKINKKNEQKRFQVVKDSMEMRSVEKAQFAGLNDKRYYFHDDIISHLVISY